MIGSLSLIESGTTSVDSFAPYIPEISSYTLSVLAGLTDIRQDVERPRNFSVCLTSDDAEPTELTLNALHANEQRVLLTTHAKIYDPAWGALGPSLLFDRRSGALLKVLQGSDAILLPSGQFILGLEGYDLFDSGLYDAQGDCLQRWRSFGHYLVGDDSSVRVVERDRCVPSRAHVVALQPDGVVQRGPAIRDGSVVAPLLFSDQSFLLFDNGVLRQFDSGLVEVERCELMHCCGDGSQVRYSTLRRDGHQINLSLYQRDQERATRFYKHLWKFEFH